MNKQKYQTGFAHLAILTVILAVGLIGTLGFVYYQNFIQKKDGVSKVETKDEKEEEDVTSGWTTLDTSYFSMPIPDGWSIQKLVIQETNEDKGLVLTHYGEDAIQALKYTEGTKAIVDITKEPQYAGHGISSSFVIDYRNSNNFSASDLSSNGYTKQNSLTTEDGVSIEKYHKFFSERPDTIETPIVAGTNEYIYHFIGKNNRDVHITYDIKPGQDNNLAELELAIKKIEL